MNKRRILVTEEFQNDLIQLINYTSQDKPQTALKFKKEVLRKIKTLDAMPFRNRQSIYFNNKQIRDIIFKGYVITYLVEKDCIKVFSILKHRLQP